MEDGPRVPGGRPYRPAPRRGQGLPPPSTRPPRRPRPASSTELLRARDVRELRARIERGDVPGPAPRAAPPRRPPSGKGAAPRGRPRPGRPQPIRRFCAALPALRGAKLVLVLVSILVFGLTGFSWASFQSLRNGLSTTDATGFAAPDGATDLLLIGNDSRTDAQGNPLPPELLDEIDASDDEGGDLTDTMILVRIPNDGTRAVAISLPRDLYVRMPDGFGQHKLNSAFARARNDAAMLLVEQGMAPERVREQSIATGRSFMVRTIENLTGAEIDHYAEVNLLGFARLTEAVGGVPVCLRAPVDDEFSGASFPAGLQTVSGDDALAFVRQRRGLPRGDLDRVVRQQVFLAGLADQVLSTGTLAKPGRISDLIDATQQALVLDDNLDVLDFAARMRGVAAGDVSFETVPVLGEAGSDGDGSVLEVDPQAVRRFVSGALQPPAVEAATTEPAGPLIVDVLNASGTTGLAAGVSDQLVEQGFAPGARGNAEPRADSVVRHAPGEEQAAEAVAGALGGLPLEVDETIAPGSAEVYLGADYSGPSTVATPLVQLEGPATAATTQPTPPPPPITAGDVPCVD